MNDKVTSSYKTTGKKYSRRKTVIVIHISYSPSRGFSAATASIRKRT